MIRSRRTVRSLVERGVVRGDDTTHIYLHELPSTVGLLSTTLPDTDPAIPEHELAIGLMMLLACFRMLHTLVHDEMASGGTCLLPARVETYHAANDATFRKRTVPATRLRSVIARVLLLLQMMRASSNRRFPIISTAAQWTTSP